MLWKKCLQPPTQGPGMENYSLHSQDSQTFEKVVKWLLLQFLPSPARAWSMRLTSAVLEKKLDRNAVAPRTLSLPQPALV